MSVAVLSVLGLALVGLMSAAVTAWRVGESSRQTQERLQVLRRQIDEDFAAAILDPPPVPDFHYVLDTLASLPADEKDPYYIIYNAARPYVDDDASDGNRIVAFYDDEVVLRVRVPFRVGAALLKARVDVPDDASWARIEVTRNNPDAPDPADRETPSGTWMVMDSINEGTQKLDGAIGGAETDISEAVRYNDVHGDIIFIKATLGGDASFLEADRLRAEGRPVLVLDCYRDPDALPDPDDQPRPTFAAWFEGDTQVVTFTRTIPGEMEKRTLREAGAGSGYLNHYDDNGNGEIDEAAELQPLGGRAQVVYRIRPYEDAGRRGLAVFRRAFEAPITRPPADVPAGSLRPNLIATVREMEDDSLGAGTRIPSHESIPNVLYLGLSFWGGETTTWEQQPHLDPDYDASDPPRPASTRWVSSRYMPEQVQVTVALEPDRGKRTSTGLKAALTVDTAGRITVSSTKGFYNVERSSDSMREFLRDPRHYIKIEHEWIYYDRVDSETTFALPNNDALCRGMRHTTPAAHPAGAEVYRGVVSVFTVNIPAYRHWRR